MRIAFLMQDTGSVYGAERATLDLVCGLMAEGACEVLLILINEERMGLGESAFAAEAMRRVIPCRILSTASRLSPRLARGIREVLNEERVDVLHTVGYKADLHGGWAAGFGRRVPSVATVHGWLNRPDAKERFYGWINRQALRRFQRVIVLSSYYEQWLTRLGFTHLVRIPSGYPSASLVPPDAAHAPISSPDPLTVGLMGRLSEEKNHAMFLRVVRRLAETKQPIRFLIAGEGPERTAIESAIAQMGLQERVSLIGYVDCGVFMCQVHVVVMCSKIENLPYTILEAMNWMRPVIATRVGGIPDLVEDGVTGCLVEPDDDEAMAACLEQMVQNPGTISAMASAARSKLEREFSQRAAVTRHAEVYRSLIAGG